MNETRQPRAATIDGERVLLYWDTCAWVVHGVDRDVAAQSMKDPSDALGRFSRLLAQERDSRGADAVFGACNAPPMCALLAALWSTLPP